VCSLHLGLLLSPVARAIPSLPAVGKAGTHPHLLLLLLPFLVLLLLMLLLVAQVPLLLPVLVWPQVGVVLLLADLKPCLHGCGWQL
jgi:hypothetical protein